MMVTRKNYNRVLQYILLIILISSSLPNFIYAQKDTSKRQSIEIISSYKPSLKNIAKINLTPTPLTVDSATPKLRYDIPAMNLVYYYQPINLKPLALTVDTAIALGVRNYIKAGYGNYSTPFLQAAINFGDRKTALINSQVNYISSKGSLTDQSVSLFNLKTSGSYFMPKNEVYGTIGYSHNQYYQYGYDHSKFMFNKDSINRGYGDLFMTVGLKNSVSNEQNISYNGTLNAYNYSRGNIAHENDINFSLPVRKKINDDASLNLVMLGDESQFTHNSTSSTFKINNSLFEINPSVDYHINGYTIHGGLKPTFDNSKTYLLPDFYTTFQLVTSVIFEGGWEGTVIKNSYKSLTTVNPYLDYPTFLQNTKAMELFGGIRTKIRHHMDVLGKVELIRYSNMPLFITDSTSSKGFYISNAAHMNDLKFHGEIRYYSQDKFSITGVIDANTYSSISEHGNAYGLVPFQFGIDGSWKVMNDLTLKSNFTYLSGIPMLLSNNIERILPAAYDLSVSGEFRVASKFKVWLDINNLLNKKYERWNNYPVLGLQVVGGLIYQF